ncbi:MAG: hypothetical protein ACUVRD_04030 [Bacteroidia bacterium]
MQTSNPTTLPILRLTSKSLLHLSVHGKELISLPLPKGTYLIQNTQTSQTQKLIIY